MAFLSVEKGLLYFMRSVDEIITIGMDCEFI